MCSILGFLLETLKEKQDYTKVSKYEFWVDIVAFSGCMVSSDGVKVFLRRLRPFRIRLDLLQILRSVVFWGCHATIVIL